MKATELKRSCSEAEAWHHVLAWIPRGEAFGEGKVLLQWRPQDIGDGRRSVGPLWCELEPA